MNKQALLLSLLFSAVATLGGQAKPNQEGRQDKGTPPAPDRIVKHLDRDDSGTLSIDEAKGPIARNFDRIDVDSNGEISLEELTVVRENRSQKASQVRGHIQAADTDGNGAISIDEATEAELQKIIENFDNIDANGDGEISKREMRVMSKDLANRKCPRSLAE